MADTNKKDFYTVGKIFFKAKFELDGPLIIGCGEDEHADIDVIRDNKTDSQFQTTSIPIIPASSVIGIFRSQFNKIIGDELDAWNGQGVFPIFLDHFYEFFGYDENDQKKLLERYDRLDEAEQEKFKESKKLTQSSFAMADIELKSAKIAIRDGVKIDPRTNTAVEKAKYDYELVEWAEPFEMIFEITKRHGSKIDYDYFKSFVGFFIGKISNGSIRIGAKGNKGFGKLKLVGEPKLAELDFQKGSDVWEWLKGDLEGKKTSIAELIKYNFDPVKEFCISGDFRIKNSMLIKSYPTDPGEPDAVHIKSNDKNVLPGASIMGAVRHRVWKIINTMFKDEDIKKENFHNLFGYVYVESSDAQKDDKINYPGFPDSFFKVNNVGKREIKHAATKGRVMIDESVINNDHKSILERIQTRIKIDRFTGGTIAGALLQEKALWQKGEDSVISLTMRIKGYKPWEPALFMFILKDLVTGDLPIGGEKSIGRGVLIGNSATISWTGEKPQTIELEFDKDGYVKEKDQKKLEQFSNFTDAWISIMNETKKVEGAIND